MYVLRWLGLAAFAVAQTHSHTTGVAAPAPTATAFIPRVRRIEPHNSFLGLECHKSSLSAPAAWVFRL